MITPIFLCILLILIFIGLCLIENDILPIKVKFFCFAFIFTLVSFVAMQTYSGIRYNYDRYCGAKQIETLESYRQIHTEINGIQCTPKLNIDYIKTNWYNNQI